MVHISTTITDLVTGFFLPVVIALITKSAATNFQKRLVLAICSAIASVITTIATHAGNIVGMAGWFNLGIVFLMSIASYYGWWKGGTAFEALKSATGNFGFGSKPVPNPEPAPGTVITRQRDAGSASVTYMVKMSIALCVMMMLALAVGFMYRL